MLPCHHLGMRLEGCSCYFESLIKRHQKADPLHCLSPAGRLGMAGGAFPAVGSTFVGGRTGLRWPGGFVFAAQFPEGVQKEHSGKAEHDKDFEQAVHRPPRVGGKDPSYARERNQAEHDGNQKHHGKQIASSSKAGSHGPCSVIREKKKLHRPPLLAAGILRAPTLGHEVWHLESPSSVTA